MSMDGGLIITIDTPKGQKNVDDDILNFNQKGIQYERDNYGTSLTAVKTAMLDSYYASPKEVKTLSKSTLDKGCNGCYDTLTDSVACVTFMSSLEYGSVDAGYIDFIGSHLESLRDKLQLQDWVSNMRNSGEFQQNGTKIEMGGKILYFPIGGKLKRHSNIQSLKKFVEHVYKDTSKDNLTKMLLNNSDASTQPIPPTFVTTITSFLETIIRKNLYIELDKIKNLKNKLGINVLSDVTKNPEIYTSEDENILITKITAFKKRITRLLGMFDEPLGILRNIVKIIWVPRKFLYRPCYDYESSEYYRCSLTNLPTSVIGKSFEDYIRNFPKYVDPTKINDIKLSDWNFPFTRLGYTYDVEETGSQDTGQIVGVSEFILMNGTPYQVIDILSMESFIDILLDSITNKGEIIPTNPLDILIKRNPVTPRDKIGGNVNYSNKYQKYKGKYIALKK